MMDLLLATSGGEAQVAGGGYVDDVFSAYTYTGNGATQTINNGIDLAGKGGLVWLKNRTSAGDHYLFDTARGALNELNSNNAEASASLAGSLTAFLNNGFSVGGSAAINQSGQGYVGWQFRKAPKFFDVVTYTGNGVVGRQIAHSLGVAPGMVIVKNITEAASWKVWHRTLALNHGLVLNSSNAIEGQAWLYSTAPTDSLITIGNAGADAIESNKVGNTYVAYLFAHDPSAEGIIQCGSFEGGQTNGLVSLGWEPQYLLTKCASTTNNWTIHDVQRGWTANGAGNANVIRANLPDAEATNNSSGVQPTANGFTTSLGSPGQTYIYLAIRRPNKPPTSGTQVYNAIARTGTGAAATVTGVGFAPDLVIAKSREQTGSNLVQDKLRGTSTALYTDLTNAESALTTAVQSFTMDGISVGSSASINANALGESYINHFFRRAKGVFDLVCDTGTGVAHGVNHGLSVAPEFVIRKSRSGATQWECWHSALAATEKLVLNSTAAKATDTAAWNSTFPTSTQFTVGTGANVNTNAATYVTYLFATLAGISKVGSYTGNGTSQTINCGFSTGSRFILVRRTDATGDWYVWDSVRGIIAANDPHLSLNTTAAEVTTDDSVDPDASGFIVNQNTATNINVNSGQYIFLAIA